jgi:hypothetical protein
MLTNGGLTLENYGEEGGPYNHPPWKLLPPHVITAADTSPMRPGFTQSATQNWVLGSSSGLPGMVVGAGYSAQSQSTYGEPYYAQGGHLQVPGIQ